MAGDQYAVLYWRGHVQTLAVLPLRFSRRRHRLDVAFQPFLSPSRRPVLAVIIVAIPTSRFWLNLFQRHASSSSSSSWSRTYDVTRVRRIPASHSCRRIPASGYCRHPYVHPDVATLDVILSSSSSWRPSWRRHTRRDLVVVIVPSAIGFSQSSRRCSSSGACETYGSIVLETSGPEIWLIN